MIRYSTLRAWARDILNLAIISLLVAAAFFLAGGGMRAPQRGVRNPGGSCWLLPDRILYWRIVVAGHASGREADRGLARARPLARLSVRP